MTRNSRSIMSENFYGAIQRPNANLVTEEIKRIEKSGVRTCEEQLFRDEMAAPRLSRFEMR